MSDKESYRILQTNEEETALQVLDPKVFEAQGVVICAKKSPPKKCLLVSVCSFFVILLLAATCITIWGLQSNKQTTTEENKIPKMTNLLVIGGSTGSGPRLATSELLSWNRSCRGSFDFPRLPTGVTGARSAYINGHVVLCGGWNTEGDCQDNCYKLMGENMQWTTASPLQHKRSYFSLTKVNHELYAVGGYGNTRRAKTDTMEKLTKQNKWILMNQKMRTPRAEHCTVYLATKKSLVIIGGVFSSVTNVVEILNLGTLTWSNTDPLPISDIRGHACLTIKQDKEESIIVTGGWSTGGGGKQRAVYRYKNNKWSQHGYLVEARIWHSMGLWNGTPVVVAGRYSSNHDENLKSLERMDMKGLWKLMSVNLNFEISGHSMVEVPDEDFTCL